MIPYVERSLQAHFSSSSASTDGIDTAIISAFQSLDNDILADGLSALENAKSHAEVQARLAPCYAGSCALLVLYDPVNAQLHIANTGDSRAVLGSLTSSTGDFHCIPMSTDQTASNTEEVERVKALHPNEPNLITKRDGDCCRYAGISVTRAFGDARWKWSKDALQKCERDFSGKPAPANAVNPPYLEATPEVKTFKLKEGDFMILASDGLWNHLSSEDAIYGVAKWIELVKDNALAEIGSGTPVMVGGGVPPAGHRAEGISFWEYTKTKAEWFVYEDQNSATHLVKNAFGGSQRQLFTGMMTVDTPTSKTMRDDVTVQVIFFGGI